MKRIIASGVMVAALLLPAAAFAAREVYFGSFDGVSGSEVKMKVRGSGDEREVASFVGRQFEVDCEGGTTAEMRRAGIFGSFPIGNQGGFRAKDFNGQTTIRVKGQVGAKRAFGTFRFFGEIEVNGTTMDCDSGRLVWKARTD